MRKMLGGVLVGLLVVSGLSGCRVGGEPVAAEPAPENPEVDTEELTDAVSSWLRTYDVLGTNGDFKLTVDESVCAGKLLVKELDVETLRTSNVVDEELEAVKPARPRWERGDAQQVKDVLFQCSPLEDWVVDGVILGWSGSKKRAADITLTQNTCVLDVMTGTGFLDRVVVTGLMGVEIPQRTWNRMAKRTSFCVTQPGDAAEPFLSAMSRLGLPVTRDEAECVSIAFLDDLLEAGVKRNGFPGEDVPDRLGDRIRRSAVLGCVEAQRTLEEGLLDTFEQEVGALSEKFTSCLRTEIDRPTARRIIGDAVGGRERRARDAVEDLVLTCTGGSGSSQSV